MTMAGKKRRRIRRLERQLAAVQQAQQLQQAQASYAMAQRPAVPTWALAGGTDRFNRALSYLCEREILPRWVTANKWRSIGSTHVLLEHGPDVSPMLAGNQLATQRQWYRLDDLEAMRAAVDTQASKISREIPKTNQSEEP